MHNIREVVAFVMESKYGEHQKKKKNLSNFHFESFFLYFMRNNNKNI
jgi:hypothetical protein